MFALIGGLGDGVSVKTDGIDTAGMLIAAGVGHKAPCMQRSRISLPPGPDPGELRLSIPRSYRIIRAGLPKRAQARLDPA